MARLTIRKEDDPILRKKSREVTQFDEKLNEFIHDMIETMHGAEGVGLAAVQVGKLRRVLVFDEYQEEGPGCMINPDILEREGELCELEGCLSVGGRFGKVLRPASIRVRYQDEEGRWQERKAEGHLARILCHEIDHLEGILFTDKMTEEVFLQKEEGEDL